MGINSKKIRAQLGAAFHLRFFQNMRLKKNYATSFFLIRNGNICLVFFLQKESQSYPLDAELALLLDW